MTALIGLTARKSFDAEKQLTAHGVGASYIESVLAAGGTPVIIPLIEDEKLLRRLFDAVDGILFPGGEDVDPKYYNQEPHPKLGRVDSLRDKVEITLCRWAFAEDKPVLGLCRGIQMMNVALGGTLIQDIPSQIQASEKHSQESRDWSEASHELKIQDTSNLAAIVGATSLAVNSFHHQALDKIASKLVVVGESDDGLAEAVEAKDKKFFVGLQCHPENLWQGTDERWLRVFRAFVGAAERA